MKNWKSLAAVVLLAVTGCASQSTSVYTNPKLLADEGVDFKPEILTQYYRFYGTHKGGNVVGYGGNDNYGGYPEYIDFSPEYYQVSYNSWNGYTGPR